ncbi:phage tail protein [Actinomyces sp.]
MAGHVVKVSVVAETKNFSRAFKGLAKETGLTNLANAGKQAVTTLATVAAAGAAAIGVAGAKAVSAAADLEQSTGAIEAVFKSGADQMKAYADTAASTVGLTKNEYQELGTLLGAQLKNGGTSIDQLAGKTNDLIGVAADLSAQFGGSTSDAVAALSSALKGERDPIERYGVSLKQASIDAKAAELGFQKVGGSFDNEAQQAATLALIMEQTADAHGAFAREGDTLAHQVQVLKAHFGDFAAKAGTLVLPMVTALASAALDHLVPALESLSTWAKDIAIPALQDFAARIQATVVPKIKQAAAVFQTEIRPRLQALIDWLTTTVPPAVSRVVAFFEKFGPAIGAAAAVIGTFVAGFKTFNKIKTIIGAAKTAWAALNATMAANPIFLVIAAIAALVAIFVALYQNNETFRAAVDAAWAQIKAAVSVVVEWFQTNVVPALQAAWANIQAAWDAVWPQLQAAWASYGQPVVDLIVSVFQGLAANWDTIWQGISTVVSGVWQVISSVISTVVGVISGIIQVWTSALSGDWQGVWDGIKQIVSSVWDGIKGVINGALSIVKGYITGAMGVISGIFSGVWSSISSTVSGAWNGIKSAISSGVSSAISTISSLPSRALSALGNLGSTLWNAGKSLIQGFINGISSMFGSVKSKLGSLTSSLASWKGPADYDAVLLTPAGRLVIDGFIRGLESRYGAVRRSLGALTGMVADTDAGSLGLPDASGLAGMRARGGVTIHVTAQMLNPSIDAGRVIAQSIDQYTRLNGAGR